jgi:hypothetical protein
MLRFEPDQYGNGFPNLRLRLREGAMKSKLFGAATALVLFGVVSPAFSTEVGFVYGNGTFTDIAVPGSIYTNPSGKSRLKPSAP